MPFLPPPPRPFGRAGRRRLVRILLWGLLGGGGTFLILLASWLSSGWSLDAGPIVMRFVGLGLGIGTAGQLFIAVKEMLLLRFGVEAVARGTGEVLEILREGRTRSCRAPYRYWSHVRIRERHRAAGYLVLASKKLRWVFFPDLRDVPLWRLTGDEEILRLLPAPVRATPPVWREWLKAKFGEHRKGVWVAGVMASVMGLMFGAVAIGRGDVEGWQVLWLAGFLALPGLPGLVTALVWIRGHWRDRVLWLDGEEVHGILLQENRQGARVRYWVTYSMNGHEFRRSAWAPADWEAWRVESPRDAPAVTQRVVLLVDPARPARWTLVPGRCAGVV